MSDQWLPLLNLESTTKRHLVEQVEGQTESKYGATKILKLVKNLAEEEFNEHDTPRNESNE